MCYAVSEKWIWYEGVEIPAGQGPWITDPITHKNDEQEKEITLL